MKIVISGYGKMGHMIEAELKRQNVEIAAITEDVCGLDENLIKDCICIDFTTPDAIRNNYRFLAEHFAAVVIGTTGWNDIKNDVIQCFNHYHTPMIYASNFSVGVNVLFAATEQVAKLLGKSGGYTAYIEEMHHCHKLDRPSGTAKSLSEIVSQHLPEPDVASVRCGEIAGIHTVGFEGSFERLTLRHEAFSREGFAAGAVLAAKMSEHTEGVHEFKDLLLK